MKISPMVLSYPTSMRHIQKNDTLDNGTQSSLPSSLYIWCEYTSLPYETSTFYKINVMFVGIANCVFGMSAILLNALLLTVFVRNHNLAKGSNIILFGLCMADFISGVIVQLPMSAVMFMIFGYGNTNIDCVLMTLSAISGYIFVGISLMTVSFVSFERFISIFYPYVYVKTFTASTMVLGSVSIWVFMVGFILYCYITLDRVTFFIFQGACISLTYIWTIIVYFKILKQVRKITKEEANLTRRLQQKEADHELKANRIVRFVILSLLTCYLPQVVFALFQLTGVQIRIVYNYIQFWAFTFGMINCSLNPLVYCYCNSEIRKKVYELIGLLRKKAECSSETVRPTPNPTVENNA